MERQEKKLFEVARELVPDLEELLGPRSLAILDGGNTLHIEAAAAPDFYRREFSAQLLKHLDRVAPGARAQRVGSTTVSPA